MREDRDGWFAGAAWPWILAGVALGLGCQRSEAPRDDAAISSPSAAASAVERSTGETTAGSATGAPPSPPPANRTRYAPEGATSPVTADVAAHLLAIARRRSRQANSFMKVGASGTASGHFLACFAGSPASRFRIDLDRYGELQQTIDFFRGGRVGGQTPFDRLTRAAVSGKSAGWVLAGNPSPLDVEIEATNPRFAFVGFGTNDLNFGPSPRLALPTFHENLARVLDRLEAEGIVPIVTGLPPRDHAITAERWVPIYDAVTRGVAEQRRLPYLSLYQATKDLPARGLVRDGIHGNAYRKDGIWQPCDFTPAALKHHYNLRNLASLRWLDTVRRVTIDGAPAPDGATDPWRGTGTTAAPFEVDHLPFTHSAIAPAMAEPRDAESCPSPATESRTGVVYRLTLDESTPLRIAALGRGDATVQLAVLDAAGKVVACIAREGPVLQRRLPAGSYRLWVDGVVGRNPDRVSEYLLVILRCEPHDPTCG